MIEIKTAIAQGEPFTYTGNFVRLKGHTLTFNKTNMLVIDEQAPDYAWLVDRFDDQFPDTAKYVAAKRLKQQHTADVWSPGLRLWNNHFGFIGILFSECQLKENQSV